MTGSDFRNKPILKINKKILTVEDFINTFWILLAAIVNEDRKLFLSVSEEAKIEKERFWLTIFDQTLETMIDYHIIYTSIGESYQWKSIPEEEIEDSYLFIKQLYKNLEIQSEIEPNDKNSFTNIANIILNTNDSIIQEINRSELTEYKNVENFYLKNFQGFPNVSFLFATIPYKEKKLISEIRKDVNSLKPEDVEKKYYLTPNSMVYYYDKIQVFDYMRFTKEFESKKMYDLLEILETLGIDEFSSNLEKEFEIGKLAEIKSRDNLLMYKFFDISYSKPEFNEDIYESFKEVILVSYFDDFMNKTVSSLEQSSGIEFFEDNLNTLINYFKKVLPEIKAKIENIL